MEIRPFEERDWPGVWAIVREVLAEGDTFAYDPAMTESEARASWGRRGKKGSVPEFATFVAVDGDELLGVAISGANRPGPGAHVATGSFMVAAHARGRRVGRALVEHTIAWARAAGYAAMQFNAVVETNTGAVKLYEDLGFTIIGTVPQAFQHPQAGRVGLHVMHLWL